MPKKANPFQNYVEHRLQMIAINQDEESRESSKQSITVRLNPGQVRLIDQLAKNLEQSRQLFLVEILETSIRQVVEAYADTCGDKAQEVYRELMDLTGYQEGDI